MSEHGGHELPRNQAIADAVFNKPVPHATSEQQKQVEDLRKAAVPEVTPLEQLQVRAADIPTLASMQVVIEKNIGADKTGGKIRRSAEQRRRFDQATEASQMAIEVLDKGYPGLTEGQKRQIQERVYPAMLRLWPELNTAFTGMTRRQRQKAMEDILNDPDFQREVKSLVTGIKDTYKEGETKTDEETKLSDKNEELEKEQAHLNELKRSLEEVQEKKASFERGGTNFRKLESGLPSLAALDAAIDARANSLKNKRDELKRVDNQYSGVAKYENNPKNDDEIKGLRQRAIDLRQTKENLEDQIERLEQEHTQYVAAKKEREALEAEKKKTQDDEKKAQQDVDNAERKVNKLLGEKLNLQADMGISKLEKDAYEEKFVKDVQDIFATAAERVVTKRLTAAQEAAAAQATAEHHGDELPESVENRAKSRYVNRDGTLNKERIKSDYRRFMNGGLENITRDVVGGSDQVHKAEEAGKFEAYEDQTAKELLTRYIQAGGKFTKSDIDRIVTTRASNELITEAIERNETLRKAIEAADEKANPHEEHHGSSFREKIHHVVGMIPKPTANQLLIIGALAAGGFFAGPAIIDAVLPHIHHAASRWVVEAHKHKFIAKVGHAAKEAPHTIAHAADAVEDKVL